MPAPSPARHAPPRRRQALRIGLVVAIFAGLVGLTVFIRQTFDQPLREAIKPPPGEEADLPRHVGTVRLWPDRDGRCPEFRFDNDTGILTPSGSVECVEGASPNRPISPTGRMDTIREGFRRR